MKKLLTVLLVVAMVLSLGSVAFGAELFSDVADQPAAAKTAITKLNALDIIEGYPDGTFKPNSDITRAEFAKIACIAAGLKESGEILKNTPSTFKDIKQGEWYTGWVNLAHAQSYVKGFPDGTFKPNNKITNAEVVTVLLRVLGYDDNLPGPWPIDYIAKASTLGVTDDVIFDAAANAVRSGVSIMAANTLDQDIVYWDTDKARFLDVTEGSPKTLMADNFDGAVFEKYLVTDFEINDDVYNITFVEWKNDKYDPAESTTVTTLELAETGRINGVANVPALENRIVDFIYDADDKDVKFIDVKNYDLVVFNEVEITGATKAEIDDKKYNFVNNKIVIDNDGTATTANAENGNTLAGDVVKATLNKDGKIAYLTVENYPASKIVDKYDANRKRITTLAGSSITFGKDDTYLIVKDGKIIEPKDLDEFDALVYFDNDKGVDHYIKVSSSKVSGEFEASSNNNLTITVGGKKYDVATAVFVSTNGGENFASFDNSYDDFYDEEVTLLFDIAGNVAGIMSDKAGSGEGGWIYGTLVSQGESNKAAYNVAGVDGNQKYIRILKADGTEASYKVKNSFEENGKIDDFVRFTVDSNNVVKAFENGFGVTGTATQVDTKNSRVLIGNSWYKVASDVVVFETSRKTSATGGSDDEEAIVVDYSKLEKHIDGAANTALTYYISSGSIKYIAVNTALSTDSTYAVITDFGRNVDGEYIRLLTSDGKNLAYTLGSVDTTGFAKGDLVSFKLSNDDVDELEMVVDKSAAAFGTEIDEISGKSVKFGSSWYVVTEDTVFFDLDAKTVLELDDLGVGDEVEFDKNNDGELEYIVIK